MRRFHCKFHRRLIHMLKKHPHVPPSGLSISVFQEVLDSQVRMGPIQIEGISPPHAVHGPSLTSLSLRAFPNTGATGNFPQWIKLQLPGTISVWDNGASGQSLSHFSPHAEALMGIGPTSSWELSSQYRPPAPWSKILMVATCSTHRLHNVWTGPRVGKNMSLFTKGSFKFLVPLTAKSGPGFPSFCLSTSALLLFL